MFLKEIANLIYRNSRKFCSIAQMSESNVIRKPKYDGRSKKRKWEERRTDKGSAFDGKRVKENVEENGENLEAPLEKVKRRKYVLLLGYSGQNYFGMQRNPKTKTIEEELFTALLKVNYIGKDAFDQVQLIQYQRAARTDKGVSAARQVVSIKLPEDVNVENINKELPEVIRVFGVRRVTKGFNSKSQCDARTYNYILPTVAFAKNDEAVEQETFRLSDNTFDEINNLMKMYLGTKNYHNFTSKKKPKDPSAKRYIMSFECEKPFLSNDVEFAVVKVKGQSFMLHQIRKMVGLLVAVIRGHATKDTIEKAFTEDKVNVPRAPGLGLLLEFVHYIRYNHRYGQDGVHESLLWEQENEAVENFKQKYIHPVIINTEIGEKSMALWMETLHKHRYDVIEEDEEEKNNENGGSSDDEETGKDSKQKEDDDSKAADVRNDGDNVEKLDIKISQSSTVNN